ncbi:MAG: hypothetical protein O3C48_08250 [Crenarchaeota archaeon]|nr:hypothetical protein [Thermoproteota archaeon]
MLKSHSFEEIERHLIVCKVRRFTTEESLQYLKDKGCNISESTLFTYKRKMKDETSKRVTSAVEGQVESIIHLIDTLEIIQKKLWEDLEQTTDIIQRLKIMNSIRDNEVMITKLTMDIPETVEKQVKSYYKLPVDRKLTWKDHENLVRDNWIKTLKEPNFAFDLDIMGGTCESQNDELKRLEKEREEDEGNHS